MLSIVAKNVVTKLIIGKSTFAEKQKNKKVPVYNLQVLDKHEYFANNILVHNCDSWALAEWAYSKWNADNEPQIMSFAANKDRSVDRNKDGKIVNYWPGLID